MPNGDVEDVRVSAPDLRDNILQAVGKSVLFSFKVVPSILELSFAPVVDVLPVIIDNQAGDLDVIFGQLIDCM